MKKFEEYTVAEITNMPAGHELNSLITLVVMEGEVVSSLPQSTTEYIVKIFSSGTLSFRVVSLQPIVKKSFTPSANIEDFSRVREKMREDGWDFLLCENAEKDRSGNKLTKTMFDKDCLAYYGVLLAKPGKDARDGCRAALLAKMKEAEIGE